jgi:hypothetical protein
MHLRRILISLDMKASMFLDHQTQLFILQLMVNTAPGHGQCLISLTLPIARNMLVPDNECFRGNATSTYNVIEAACTSSRRSSIAIADLYRQIGSKENHHCQQRNDV